MGIFAFVLGGYTIGISEIMLLMLGFFVIFLIIRNLVVYNLKAQEK
jgi:hypothetical protein